MTDIQGLLHSLIKEKKADTLIPLWDYLQENAHDPIRRIQFEALYNVIGSYSHESFQIKQRYDELINKQKKYPGRQRYLDEQNILTNRSKELFNEFIDKVEAIFWYDLVGIQQSIDLLNVLLYGRIINITKDQIISGPEMPAIIKPSVFHNWGPINIPKGSIVKLPLDDEPNETA